MYLYLCENVCTDTVFSAGMGGEIYNNSEAFSLISKLLALSVIKNILQCILNFANIKFETGQENI